MNRESPSATGGVDLLLGAVGVLVGLGGVLWVAAAASARVSGHRQPRLRLLDGYLAFGHAGDPSAAWRSPVGPAAVYWLLVAVILLAGGAAGWGLWWLWHSTENSDRLPAFETTGMATRREIRESAGRRALLARAGRLRLSRSRPRPEEIGFRLGAARGIECWASVEDSMLVVGPPCSGKGPQVVIPAILDAPGAVVTTSTRPDNLAVTGSTRAQRGPVMVFDPEGLAGDTPGGPARLRWSLTRGCERAQTAMARAETLSSDAERSGVENATFWRNRSVSVIRCLLHAAALDGRGPADLYRWSHAAAGAREAVTILADHPDAIPGWDRALDGVISLDARTRDSIWAMVSNAFAPLADPAVLEALDPGPDEQLDLTALLALGGTIYLLGKTGVGARATVTLVAALIEDLVDAARRLAARSPGQRLDPPLALVLDEATNYPLPSLPGLMSEGGGSGITTLAVCPSVAQARDRWGREAAQAIWDAAVVKLVLGGTANVEDLADLSRLIGDRPEREWSESRHAGPSGRSMSSTVRYRPILEPSELRRLGPGTGLLLLRNARPIMVRLRPWTRQSGPRS